MPGGSAAIVLAAVAIFETIGPPLVTFALRFCGEAHAPAEASGAGAVPAAVAPATQAATPVATTLPAAPGAEPLH